jgi:hypothetical protein
LFQVELLFGHLSRVFNAGYSSLLIVATLLAFNHIALHNVLITELGKNRNENLTQIGVVVSG